MISQRINKNGYEKFVLTFESITDYIDYLDTAKTSSTFFNKKLSSKTGTYEFTGTESFEEARDTCLEGEYSDDFTKFDNTRIQLENLLAQKRARSKIKSDILGFSPNVPAYLQGHPLDMYNQEVKTKPAKPVIRIIYNVSASSYVNKEDIRIKGVCTLALIKQLEDAGLNVELVLCECSVKNGQQILTNWILKKPNEKIDYRGVYFPMCNPSFLRRLHFRVVETTEGLENGWCDGYGCPAVDYELGLAVEAKPSDIIINSPQDLRISSSKNLMENFKDFCQVLQVDKKVAMAKENSGTQKTDD